MRSPASIAKHPIHPMLVPIPIGLWVFSLVYLINVWLRWDNPASVRGTPFVLSLIAIGLLLVSGWLGGKMVYVHGVAVDAVPETTRR